MTVLGLISGTSIRMNEVMVAHVVDKITKWGKAHFQAHAQRRLCACRLCGWDNAVFKEMTPTDWWAATPALKHSEWDTNRSKLRPTKRNMWEAGKWKVNQKAALEKSQCKGWSLKLHWKVQSDDKTSLMLLVCPSGYEQRLWCWFPFLTHQMLLP